MYCFRIINIEYSYIYTIFIIYLDKFTIIYIKYFISLKYSLKNNIIFCENKRQDYLIYDKLIICLLNNKM